MIFNHDDQVSHQIRLMGCSAQGGKEGAPRGAGDTYCAEYLVSLIPYWLTHFITLNSLRCKPDPQRPRYL